MSSIKPVLAAFVATSALFANVIPSSVAHARMTDEYFFQTVLNLEYPGLEKTKAAVEAGDYAGARKAWAEHVRTRDGIPKYFETADFGPRFSRTPRPHGGFEPYKIARKILEGDHSHWAYGVNPKSRYNCVHLRHMAWRYEENGDELFPQAWVKNMTYFIDNYPPGRYDQMDEGEFKPNVLWGLLNTGNRMSDGYWNAYMAFLHSPRFTDEAIVDYTKLMTEMAMRVRARRGFGNWETMQMEGLYSYTLLFPECRFSDQWKKFAVDIMYRYLGDHIDPDGCNVEVSKHYQAVATLQHISAMYAKAEVFGTADEFPADFKNHMERAYDFTMKIMPPDRNAFQFGEGRTFPEENPPSCGEDIPNILEADFYVLERGLELFPDRDDFRWIVTEGKEGVKPEQKSFCLPYAGFVTMRSGWGRDANFLGMKGSNTGLMHGDHGRNNVVLWAYGRPMLWNTPQGGWDAKTKSLVLVDGKNQQNSGEYGTMEPIDMAWQSTPSYDHTASMYDGFWGTKTDRPCKHVRRVLFVKPDVFLILDDMVAMDEQAHDYEARWVVKSEHLQSDGKCRVSADEGAANLAIIPLRTAGLSVESYHNSEHPDFRKLGDTYKDTSVVVHSRNGSGNQRFVTLLLPLKSGESNPVLSVAETNPDRYSVRLRDNRTFHIALDASQSGRIHFAEDGGARREIDMVSGSIDRPFYLHYENFEVFDERETKITYANLTHHVPAPDDVSGVQGRFVGAIDLSKAETVSARRSKALPIPAGIEALTAKSIVALAEKPQGKTRVRMGLQMQGDTCSGPWLDLDATATEQFKQYQAVIPIPSGAQQYMPILEVESSNVGSGQTAYVDQIRVRYPEKQ